MALASDVNGELNNIISNAADLVSPFTKAISMGGFALNFDAANTIALTGATNGINLTGGAFNTPQGADIASAATINLDTATGNLVDVTGTVTITAITLAQGRERTVRFTGALTLTHGASLVLPRSANITTTAGDYAIFRGYASGVVRCVSYEFVTATAGLAALGGFPASNIPSGTAMLFAQTAAPTGWTKVTTHNDKVLRVVSGTASSGGATAFSAVFGAGKLTGSTSLTAAQSGLKQHYHDMNSVTVASGSGSSAAAAGDGGNLGGGVNGAGSSGTPHDHTLSLDLQYVDLIIATKAA